MPKMMYLLSPMLLLMSSCAPSLPATDSFCVLAHPIYLNQKDSLTVDTSRAILSHDVTGTRLCGWEKI